MFVVEEDQGATARGAGDAVRFRGTLYFLATDFGPAEKAAQVTLAAERALPGHIAAARDRIRTTLTVPGEDDDIPVSNFDDDIYVPKP